MWCATRGPGHPDGLEKAEADVNLFRPLPRTFVGELMDEPGVPEPELLAALGYIRRVNRYLGYTRATRNRLRPWLEGRSVTLLDVATGSGDVPADLRRHFPGVGLFGLDMHPVTIAEAARRVPGCAFVRGDALRLPFADASVDYVISSLFLHHLPEQQIVEVMAEMWRVARRGVLAADLLRSRRALAWITLLTLTSPPMIRHDARASVRAALTATEVLALARRAGWHSPVLRRHVAHRFTLAAVKPSPSGDGSAGDAGHASRR